MFLEKFDDFQSVYIQCHDCPDADAIGSGFGLYEYFRQKGKEVHLIYTGNTRITKPALQLMVERLSIPIEYVDELPECEVLITVDCQYKGGNITPLPAGQVAMIDHHPPCVPTDEWCYIVSDCGSCSTVVWMLLSEAGYDVRENRNAATALYYGLYSDTGQLSEIYHPKDREMRDCLTADGQIIDRETVETMINSNLSMKELKIAGRALSNYYYDEEYQFAVMRTEACDPNMLGVISDLVIQVAGIDVCVVYNETPIGYKMSLRTCRKHMKASKLASYISDGIGSGGGHNTKAGGFILKKIFLEAYPDCLFGEMLQKRLRVYMKEAEDAD
ncbi:MAG: DHH family phosphoesterase [Lachnospiraceae bacterium]|nr:DHH family phosphoesterase [Lachnospiraceae bacterium]